LRSCRSICECDSFGLREPSERLREILETVVRKSSHLICELFLSLGYEFRRISVEYAAAQVLCLRRKGFHDSFSLFTSKMRDEISGEGKLAEGQTWNRLFDQCCDIAHASFIKVRCNGEDESKRRLLIARDLPEQGRNPAIFATACSIWR
jgi:hypothetical protein